jgi:hypothetical protein
VFLFLSNFVYPAVLLKNFKVATLLLDLLPFGQQPAGRIIPRFQASQEKE